MSFRISQNLAWKVKKGQHLTYGTQESQTFSQKLFIKLFHKNFSLRSQRVNLVSSKVISQRSQNPRADPPLLVLVVKHDWNAFVTKFLRGLQNYLKIRSSCDFMLHMLTGRTERSETVHQIMNH